MSLRITTADPLMSVARAQGVRHRATPIVPARALVEPLGDPRGVPFDARTVGRPFVLATILQAVVCFGFVAVVWGVLS